MQADVSGGLGASGAAERPSTKSIGVARLEAADRVLVLKTLALLVGFEQDQKKGQPSQLEWHDANRFGMGMPQKAWLAARVGKRGAGSRKASETPSSSCIW